MRKKPTESFLDGEKLFEHYFAMGNAASISLLAKFALTQGMKDSKGNGPTNMGVWKAMWRWASMKDNKSKAFTIFSNFIDQYGWEDNSDYPWDGGNRMELWHRFMLQKIRSAWQYRNDAAYNRFLQRNGWNS